MKTRILTLISAIGVSIFMTGADFMSPVANEIQITKKFCSGYIVIEAGKGVDCNGDTIMLVTRKGYYERLHIEQPTIDEGVAAN